MVSVVSCATWTQYLLGLNIILSYRLRLVWQIKIQSILLYFRWLSFRTILIELSYWDITYYWSWRRIILLSDIILIFLILIYFLVLGASCKLLDSRLLEWFRSLYLLLTVILCLWLLSNRWQFIHRFTLRNWSQLSD